MRWIHAAIVLTALTSLLGSIAARVNRFFEQCTLPVLLGVCAPREAFGTPPAVQDTAEQ